MFFESGTNISTGRPSFVGGSRITASGDFDGDGDTDFIVVYDFLPNDEAAYDDYDGLPVQILLNDGNGGFTEGFSETLNSVLFSYVSQIATGDLNGDGRDDFIVFPIDARSSAIDGLLVGGEPMLFLSNDQGDYDVSSVGVLFSDITGRYPNDPDFAPPTINPKTVDVADIDGDGDLDVFIEGGGEAETTVNEPSFLINDGNGNFTLDWGGRASNDYLQGENGELIRYIGIELADFNGDGLPDLVMGPLHDLGRSDTLGVIIYNDGNGFFPEENLVNLPLPDFNDGSVAATAAEAFDIDGDGDLDLMIAYAPVRRFDGDPADYSGRYIQILINDNGTLVDETATRLPDQSLPGSVTNDDGQQSNNQPVMTSNAVDINGDGFLDLLLYTPTSVQDTNPVLYLNDGTGVFQAEDLREYIGDGDPDQFIFAFLVQPFDANSDGVLDLATVSGWNSDDTDITLYLGTEAIYTGPDGTDPAGSGAAGFNELYYLNQNPDVAALVEAETYSSGLAHYLAVGAAEGRMGFAEGTTIRTSNSAEDITLANGGASVDGQNGNDTIRGAMGNDTLNGGRGADSLLGGEGDDVLFGGTQADRLDGGAGNDSLLGGNGNDTVGGGSGSDTLSGSIGDDSLNGGSQGDRLFGDSGADTLNGGGGSDRVDYLIGDDAILVDLETGEATGGFADGDVLISIESLFGGKGDDTLRALEAGSRLNGAGGDDIVTGRSGDDLLAGGNGNDVVTGGAGNDLMNGNRGDDTLDGGAGDDTLRGSAGSDTFIFSDGTGDDIVLDFRANDLLDLSDTTTDFTSLADVQSAATETEEGLLIDLGGGDSVLLANATLASLADDNLVL